MQSVVGASSFPSHEGRVGCRDWTRTWGVAWCSVLSEWRALKLHDSPSAGTRPRAVDRRALAGHRRGPGTECPRPEPHTSDLKPLAKQTRLQEWEDTEWNCVLLPRWPGGGSPRMGLGGSTCGWAHVCQSQKDVEPPLLVRGQSNLLLFLELGNTRVHQVSKDKRLCGRAWHLASWPWGSCPGRSCAGSCIASSQQPLCAWGDVNKGSRWADSGFKGVLKPCVVSASPS